MRNSILYSIFIWWLYCSDHLTVMCYKIPQVQFTTLDNGFRVSIPHEPGIENVAFNINRNRPFKGFEPGEFSGRIRTKTNDRWSFESQRRLQDDETIYVWTDVQFNKSRFRDMSAPLAVKQATQSIAQSNDNSNHNNIDNSNGNGNDNKITQPITTEEPPAIDPRGDKCVLSLTTIRNRNICRGQLIFEENFDGNELDTSRWRYEVRLPLDIADAEFVLYDTNAQLSNGLLKIEPQLWGNDNPYADVRRGNLNLGTRCTAKQNPEAECQRQPFGSVVLPPVLSARINTKHAFSFKYGRVVVRAKLPQGDWLFPLLLLEPLVNYYGQQPYASGQMRIAFVRSNLNLQTRNGVEMGGRVLHGGAVLSLAANNRDTFMVNTSRDAHFGEDFHIYSLTWDERQLSLDVDGQNYGTVNGDFAQRADGYNNAWVNGNSMAPFDQEVDEDGISRVIYNIEINQQCPLILDLITEQKNKLWTSTQSSRQLHVNDEVKINVMVKYNNALFTRTDIAHISKTLPYTITSVKSGDNPIDVCNFNGWKEQTIDPDRNSMTKVILKKQPSGKSYKPNELIFQENFQKLDTTVWSYDLFMHSNAIGDRSEEFTMFTDDKDNISVKDNKLSITPLISQRQRDGIYNITGCTGAPCYENREETCIYKRDGSRHFKYPAPVDSAKISTKDSFSFTYGRIEIRAKLPEGDWLFPYIMLQPDKLNCTTRKQLRIAYATSKDLEAFRIRGGPVILNAKFNPISKGYVFDRTSHMVFHTGIEPSKYHNFTLIWTSEQIALFVDNDKYGCISNNGQYTESYNIVLGVSAGGHLEYAEPISKPWLNSDNSAPLTFHQSFTDCCERNFGKRECTQTVKPSCSRKKKLDCNQMEPTYEKRTCSQPWGPQSNMSVEYVRVYAV